MSQPLHNSTRHVSEFGKRLGLCRSLLQHATTVCRLVFFAQTYGFQIALEGQPNGSFPGNSLCRYQFGQSSKTLSNQTKRPSQKTFCIASKIRKLVCLVRHNFYWPSLCSGDSCFAKSHTDEYLSDHAFCSKTKSAWFVRGHKILISLNEGQNQLHAFQRRTSIGTSKVPLRLWRFQTCTLLSS